MQSPEMGGTAAIGELRRMGIKTLQDLENVIPDHFAENEAKYMPRQFPSSFLGLLRDIMIIHDPVKYFTKAWKRRWTGINSGFVSLCKEYNVDIEKYIKEYDLEVL
jgi:hypothetical protein